MKQLIMLTILCILISTNQSDAQNSKTKHKKNQVYLEIFGDGLIYSVNYERLVTEDFTLRVGFGYTPGLIFVEGNFIQIPVTASYLLGGQSSKLEMGLGATFFSGQDVEFLGIDAEDFSVVLVTGILGYRYVSRGGFVFRIALTPFYSSESEPNFNLYGGLSFGFMF